LVGRDRGLEIGATVKEKIRWKCDVSMTSEPHLSAYVLRDEFWRVCWIPSDFEAFYFV
jgi:hypothetical protein